MFLVFSCVPVLDYITSSISMCSLTPLTVNVVHNKMFDIEHTWW